MLSLFLSVVCSSLSAQSSVHKADSVIKIARQEKGVSVKTHKSYIIKNYLKPVGINSYANWCAAFVSYCLRKVEVSFKINRAAVARQYITKSSIKAEYVLMGATVIPKAALVIWGKGDTWQGHIGFTTKEWSGKSGYTIEGNTSSNSTRSGGNVEEKKRTIQPFAYFRITHFTVPLYGQ